ncbi:MAG: circadian clock KaiB family protein [Pseudomonas sp.]
MSQLPPQTQQPPSSLADEVTSTVEHCELRLYVSGNTTRSTRAIQNLRTLCDTYLAGAYTLEVIDIYQNPDAARDGQIIAVPTLKKLKPLPTRLLIGDLSDTATLRSALGIE